MESPLWVQWEGVRLDRVDWGGEKMESPPRLGLETIYITPFMEGLIYYQSTFSEFRYGDRKVLGTKPHPTRGLTSTYCSYVLISLKAHSIFSFQTHTHISIYLAINVAFSSPNPNIHLSCISHLKLSIHLSCISYQTISKATNKRAYIIKIGTQVWYQTSI